MDDDLTERELRAQARDDPVGEHRFHFSWNAWQTDEEDGGDVDPDTRRGAVGIRDDFRAGREHGLDSVSFGHGSIEHFEDGLDPFERWLMEFERNVGDLGEDFSGEVVLCGAEAAGDDDEIGTRERVAKDIDVGLQVVGNCGVVDDINADLGQLGGEPLTVGV